MRQPGVYQQLYNQQQLQWRQQVKASMFAHSKAPYIQTIGDLYMRTIHITWPVCMLLVCLFTYVLVNHDDVSNKDVSLITGDTYRLNVESYHKRHGSSSSNSRSTSSSSRTSESKGSNSSISRISASSGTIGTSSIVDRHRTKAEELHLDPKQNSAQIYTEEDDTYTDQNTAVDKAVKKVLLLTYFRGGSTFLGEIFNQNKKVFYWFEPLAAPMSAYKKEHYTKDYTIDRNGYALSRPNDLIATFLRTIINIMACDINDVDSVVKEHFFAISWRKSAKFAQYRLCVTRYRTRHGPEYIPTAVERCQRHLSTVCRKSGIRVIKCIRLFVDEVIPLTEIDPELKLIYYVRDPRGTLLSRLSLSKRPLSEIPITKVKDMASFLCAKMRSDLKMALRFRKQHPDRILLIRYEDLATEPTRTILSIYGFLEMVIPEEVISWISYATEAERSNGVVGTIRTNGSAVANRWQHDLSPLHLQVIGQQCDDVIDLVYSIRFSNR